jgi:NAD(P)H-hydrate repair Nnr-like enzyme with NAD(P)H-hydrate epimerase domain
MSIPVLSSEAMRAWEARSWAAGRDHWRVIARVGALLASKLMARTQPGERVLLLAGKGHNGDDVRAMIPWLVDRRVEVFFSPG